MLIETDNERPVKRPIHPNSLANLKHEAGPGRPKGSKDKSTLVREALADAQIKIQRLPQKIRDECMDIIATEELIVNLKTARKEETRVALIKEAFDRSRGKPPVQVAMDSRSTQITGTLVDLLGLLKNVSPMPQIDVSDVIECKDSAREASLQSASNDEVVDTIDNQGKGTSD